MSVLWVVALLGVEFALFSVKNCEKHAPFFKNSLTAYNLMTPYLITIATNSQQICDKMCLRDMPTATENCRC